jgi:deoxyguanosine kinase
MNYNFITIEGCIGAGKTSLTKRLAEDFGAPYILENFEDNPYLKNFYEDPDRHAFSLELYFMAERFQQQKELLNKVNLFDNTIFSDYAFFKSVIFAGITLKKEDEIRLFKMLFNIIIHNIKYPDLILYLYKPTELLLKNIASRGRDYEQKIEASYLDNLNNAYLDFFKKQSNSTVIILDSSELDFVKSEDDYKYIKSLLSKPYDKKLNYI